MPAPAPANRTPLLLAALAALSTLIAALAFLLPALSMPPDLNRAAALAAAAATPGDLVIVHGVDDLPALYRDLDLHPDADLHASDQDAKAPPLDAALIALGPSPPLPAILDALAAPDDGSPPAFKRLIVASLSPPADTPEGLERIESRRVATATVQILHPTPPPTRRLLARAEDAFAAIERVETLRPQHRQPCPRDGSRFTCSHADGLDALSLPPLGDPCRGLLLNTSEGIGASITLTQPQADRLTLRASSTHTPTPLYLTQGATQPLVTLSAEPATFDLAPSGDTLQIDLLPTADARHICLDLDWSDAQPPPDALDPIAWRACAAATRAAALRRDPWPHALRYALRGRMGLPCLQP